MCRNVCLLSSFISLLLGGSPALAGGVDTYNAPVSGSDLLQVQRAHAETGHLEVFGRLSLVYNHNPLVWRSSDGTEVGLVEQQWGAYAAVGLALWERFQIAAMLPVYYQLGENNSSFAIVNGAALGDSALDLRFALLGREDLIELAIASRVTAPTGEAERFVGDGRVGAQVSAIASRQFGKGGLILTSSLSVILRDRSGMDDGSGVRLAVGAALPLADGVMATGEGEVATDISDFLGETSTPASLLVGLRREFGSWVAHLGGGPGLSRGIGTPDFRVLAMVGTQSSATEPRAAPIVAQPKDTDGDGILDNRDRCPTEPEDMDGFEDADGCPDLDNDRDGIADLVDKCSTEAEDVDGFEDVDGCLDADNDADGIEDSVDECPLQAENINGIQDEDGCPEGDIDGDGVFDAADLCPTEKETINGVDDEDGCPDLLRVERAQIRTLEPIYFDTGSDRLQRRSLPLLKELAAVIISRPDLGLIAIEGHTDDAGSETFNLSLSRRRAEAIRRNLIDNAVPEARLTASGFGEMRPIASNETAEGREQNRRVEFRLADVVFAQ